MSTSANHLHLGYFTLVFDQHGVTITHASGRTFRIDDEQATNGPHFLREYNALFHALRNETRMTVIPSGLIEFEQKEQDDAEAN